MKTKLRSPIDPRYVVTGLFFFINPCVSILDVLPDFIGAILLILGFMHFAQIDDRARSAQKTLTVFAFVDAGKLLAAFAVRSVAGTTWNLVFSLVFGIAEAALFSYAMLRLYAGISYRASRLDCPELLTGFSALGGLTVLVAVLKNLLAILPELTELTGDYGTVTLGAAGESEISHFIYVALTALNILVVTAYGIGWWIYTRRYFKTVKKNEEFLLKLEAQYMEEVGSRPEALTYRALKTAGILFAVGTLFLLPLRLDGIDYLPDYAAGILLLLSCARLYKVCRRECRRAFIPGALFTLLALGEWLGELLFGLSLTVDHDVGYYASASVILLRHPEKMSVYLMIVAVGVLKYIALVVFLLFLIQIFRPVIAAHTGAAFELGNELRRKKDEEIKKRLGKLLAALSVFTFIAASCGVARRLLRMFTDLMIVEYLELIGVLPLLVLFVYFFAKLEEAIDNKYYLER